MPLYACDRCGFTSADFRVDAASAHRLQFPQCDGTMKIIFRSDDAYDRRKRKEVPAGPRGGLAKSQLVSTSTTHEERVFAMREHVEADGTVHLALQGDLDLRVAGRLAQRLTELRATGRAVRLDLSELAFIDSSGLQSILVALTDARWNGWQLDVARSVSPTVARAAEITGIEAVLWPGAQGLRTTAPEGASPAGNT